MIHETRLSIDICIAWKHLFLLTRDQTVLNICIAPALLRLEVEPQCILQVYSYSYATYLTAFPTQNIKSPPTIFV